MLDLAGKERERREKKKSFQAMQLRVQFQQLYSMRSGGLCALRGGKAIAVEGAAVSVGEESLALEAQGDAGLPIQIQHYFRFRVHVINSFSRASG